MVWDPSRLRCRANVPFSPTQEGKRMKSRVTRPIALIGLTASAAVAAVGIAAASHGGNHTFPVTVTIKPDREARIVEATAHSDAPAQFCEQASIRIRHSKPGRDETLFRDFMDDFGAIHWHVPPRHKGKRVYAEVSKYDLPSRPITCLDDRSRIINAP